MTEDDREKTEPQPDAGKDGVSSQQPAEGADDVSPPTEGSPKG